jgi:hypothetical protein
MSEFYCYRQNNSGGHFHVEESQGIDAYVVIEADSPSEANSKAEDIGIYFNGCENDMDCSCCGDRWYSADEYSTVDKDYMRQNKDDMYVHYKDGSFKRPLVTRI